MVAAEILLRGIHVWVHFMGCVCVCVCVRARARACVGQFDERGPSNHSNILVISRICLFLARQTPPQRARTSSFTRFLDHTHQYTTVGRTPLDEWSARRRDLFLTTHNIHNRQTSMPPVGFEPIISPGERPQTYALDREATGTCY